jgi:hypothetical protein
MAYVKEYPNGKAVDHYREGVVVQAFVDRTTSVQGEITRIMGEFLEITHPDGNVWTVERKNLQGVITRVVWDGLCEKMITQAHDDGGKRFREEYKRFKSLLCYFYDVGSKVTPQIHDLQRIFNYAVTVLKDDGILKE